MLGGRERGEKGYKWEERGRGEGLQMRKVGGTEVLPMGRKGNERRVKYVSGAKRKGLQMGRWEVKEGKSGWR